MIKVPNNVTITLRKRPIPGGYTPRAHVDVFADIFLALNYKYPSDYTRWIKILEKPNFPTLFVSQADKELFIKKVLK